MAGHSDEASRPLLHPPIDDQFVTPENSKSITAVPQTIFSAPEPTPPIKPGGTIREDVQIFLGSRLQHIFVLTLVSLDLLGIFADIFINLYTCEEGSPSPTWDHIRDVLNIIGLVFSCIFMLELMLSIWAFRAQYFQSTFRIFDATVIVAGFVIDVLLHGILEEVASLVVILRLWRFFKIIEEFASGAQEQMDGLNLRIEQLECENQDLKEMLTKWKGSDEEADIGSYKRK